MRLRPLDREVFALAIPALGALAAEPLYVLVDTAIVGHLGTTQLASLAIAATVLTTGFTVFNFLTYGTTAQVARLHGAGRHRDAAALGSQALWLALAIGALLLVAVIAFAPAAVRLMGGDGEVADGAVLYLRIAALGAPFFMLSTAGQGFLRGIGDLRTPLVILVVAHVVNVVLEVLFVYGFGWGLAGSAWGTVIAQTGMGLAFLEVQRRAGFEPPLLARMRPLMRIGAEIAVRTTALLGSFLVAAAVLARVGDDSLAAHQIAFQLFVFLALVLDALAIAAQVLVGRLLGAGDAARARAAAVRVIVWSVVVGTAFGARPVRARRRHPARVHRRRPRGRARAGDLVAVRRADAAERRRVRARRHPDRRRRHPLPDVGNALRGRRLRARRAARARPGLGHRRRLVGPRRADRRARSHVRTALRRQPLGLDRRSGVVPCAVA